VVLRDGAQKCGEPGAGAMQAGADGANGDGEDEGDLLVGELLELAEDDDLFEEERKVFEPFADGGDGLGAGELLDWIVVGGWGIEGFVYRVDGVDGDEALVAFEVTPELAAGDAAEPGGEGRALGIVTVGLAEESEEDFLGDLLGYGVVAAETKDVAIDERPVAAIEDCDGVGGTLLGGGEQLRVGVLIDAMLAPGREHI
jgi:hypothetical protein